MKSNRILLSTVLALGTVLLTGAMTAAQSTFPKSKMYVVEGKKMVLRNVNLTFNGTGLLVTPVKKTAMEERTIPYKRIKSAVYEFATERRWGAAVVVSPLFLLSKSKKHWFTIVCEPQTEGSEDEEIVFRLDKKNYADILDAFEKSSGVKVKMEAPKG